MNKHQLTAHLAAKTSVTKATADSLVDAVFSAIADALARDETVAIAGFGKFAVRSRAARTGRNPQTGEPQSRRRGRPRSSRRRPFAMRSTNRRAEPDRCPPFVPPTSPQPGEQVSSRARRVPERLSQRGDATVQSIRPACQDMRNPRAHLGYLRCTYYLVQRDAKCESTPTASLRAGARIKDGGRFRVTRGRRR